MKILFVGMSFSIHTARWINQLAGLGWEIHIFPSLNSTGLHPLIKNVTFHEDFYLDFAARSPSVTYASGTYLPDFLKQNTVFKSAVRFLVRTMGGEHLKSEKLRSLIAALKPDIIHSLETQHAGYLVNEAKSKSTHPFPFWIHSNWGIDLHFFGRLSAHEGRIKSMLTQIDIFVTEGRRDEQLARELGYKGPMLTFASVGGGFILPPVAPVLPSSRKRIVVKGTQDMVRRGLVALRAIERSADVLASYEIIVYSATETTRAAAELITKKTGLKITVLEKVTQEQLIQVNGTSRLSICTNTSDGVPNSLLEAMMMGAFPIQSDTSMADEWVTAGKTGYLVPPEDPELIEQAIREALLNDDLVDEAALINREKIAMELPYEDIKQKAIAMYTDVVLKKGKTV